MADTKKPNFLLIMTDQQRFDMLHACNGGACSSPGLDELAGTGVNFTNAHTVCALCSPARASVFTGMYPHKHEMMNNCDMFSIIRNNFTHPEMFLYPLLEGNGYKLGYFGKWHIDSDISAIDRGFQGISVPGYGLDPGADYGFKTRPVNEYDNYIKEKGFKLPEFHPTVTTDQDLVMAGYIDDPVEASVPYFLTDKAIDFMRSQTLSQSPFFITLQFWGPHEISKPTYSFFKRYSSDKIPLWGNYTDDLKNRPYQYLRQRDEFECWYHGCSRLGPEKWKEVITSYYAHSTMIDYEILRILNELTKLGIDENTVVLFTSDHGNYSGARGGLFDKGVAMFEDIYHIPLFIRWPKVTTSRIQKQLVTNMDIMPTIIEMAGIDIPDGLHGQSLVPLLKDEKLKGREDFMAQNHGTYYLHSQRMLLWEHYKYVFTPYDIDEMYNLKEDPQELRNLLPELEGSKVVRELRNRLYRTSKLYDDPLSKVIKGYHWKDIL
ncbi:MAG: sulfatase-like hydrolase/transferase [Spirochaetes bacterium]|nr:sulfatase-like hydrolase/transferase [Spirochaetota bacterium]